MIKSVVNNASKFALLALVVALSFVLAGCAGSSQASSASQSSSASSESSESSSSAEDELVFGEQTATALGIIVRNETGADITQLSAQAVGEEATVALMKSGESLPADKQATLYLEPKVGGENEGVFTLTFLVGDTQRQLHNLNLLLIHEATILVRDDVAYITAMIDGNPVSTMQEEYDIAHPPAVEEPEPEYYYEDYGNYGGGGEPAQTEDSCVSDVILN